MRADAVGAQHTRGGASKPRKGTATTQDGPNDSHADGQPAPAESSLEEDSERLLKAVRAGDMRVVQCDLGATAHVPINYGAFVRQFRQK